MRIRRNGEYPTRMNLPDFSKPGSSILYEPMIGSVSIYECPWKRDAQICAVADRPYDAFLIPGSSLNSTHMIPHPKASTPTTRAVAIKTN